jgi:hypothetical protein
MEDIRILELRARLASALGEFAAVIRCTICGVELTGPAQSNHDEGCQLSNQPKIALPVTTQEPPRRKPSSKPVKQLPANNQAGKKPEGKNSASSGARRKPWKPKTGNEFRKPDGSFDRAAWAKAQWSKSKESGETSPFTAKTKPLGLPASLGGLD